jgi:hypothetical protein
VSKLLSKFYLKTTSKPLASGRGISALNRPKTARFCLNCCKTVVKILWLWKWKKRRFHYWKWSRRFVIIPLSLSFYIHRLIYPWPFGTDFDPHYYNSSTSSSHPYDP